MKCFNCGECCNQPVEVTPEELELMKQAGTPEQNSRLREVRVYDGHYIIEPNCPYRGCDCSIYACRPFACRAYWCGRTNPNEPIDPNRMNNPEYQEKRRPLLEDAVEWGRSHGWYSRVEE
jgi:Fe-S-cluster containining protein